MTSAPAPVPDVAALRVALLSEQAARRAAEQRASGAEAVIPHLKLMIAKMRHERFGASSERGRKLLGQLELQLGGDGGRRHRGRGRRPDQPTAGGDEAARCPAQARPRPFPGSPAARAGRRAQSDILPLLLRQAVQARRGCDRDARSDFAAVQGDPDGARALRLPGLRGVPSASAPFHVIPRGLAGPELLATILEAKFGQHLPLNRQSETFAREGIELDVSTLADWIGACSAAPGGPDPRPRAGGRPYARRRYDGAGAAKTRTTTGRLWTYVRDDQPFGGAAPPAALFHSSRDRGGEHPARHLAGYSGILRADAYAGFNDLYHPGRQPAR